MNDINWGAYWPVGVCAVYIFYRYRKFSKLRKQLPLLLREGAQIIDVRSTAEFDSGHAKGSLNIPLNELKEKTDLIQVDRPIIVCCASGSRSAFARNLLLKQGVKNVVNAGPWKNVDFCLSQEVR